MQVHVKLPFMFVHVAFASQTGMPFSHSLMSVEMKKVKVVIEVD